MKFLKSKINKKIIITITVLVLVSIFSFSEISFSAPDKEVNYQGKLTNSSDVAVADGDYDFKLTLYDAVSGGNCVWTSRGTCGTPTAKTIAVENGIFSTKLGESGDNAITLDFSSNYYLGVTIGGDSEMTPRKKIGVTGFAINSDLLDGLDSAESGTDAHIVKTDSSGDITTSADLNLGADVSLRRGGADQLDLSSGDSLNIVSGSIQMGGTSIVTSSRVLENITQATIDNIRLDGNTISATNGSGLSLHDNASNGIFIQDGGNVGIGTTGPGNVLTVQGNTEIKNGYGLMIGASSQLISVMNYGYDAELQVLGNTRDDSSGLLGQFSADANGPTLMFYKSRSATVGTKLETAENDLLGQLAFTGSGTGNSTGYDGAYIRVHQDAAATASYVKTRISFWNSSGSSAVERMRITNTGNVGIGTTGPNNQLEIYESSDNTFNVADSSWHNMVIRNGSENANNTVGLVFELNDAYHSNAGTGIAAIKSNTSGDYGAHLAFITRPESAGAVERMRIQEDGNIGINDTTPTYKLDVNGTGRFTGAVTLDSTLAVTGTISGSNLSGTNTGNQTITLTGDVTGSGTGSFDTQIAANKINANELNVSGNGTTAQYLRSDADGSFSWATPTDNNTTYSAGNDLDLSGTTFNIESQLDYVSTITRASSNLTLQTTTSGHIILNPTGNVGIGTTAPEYKLSLGSTGDKIGFYSDATHYGSIELYNPSTGGMYFDNQTAASAGYHFMSSGNEVFTIQQDGNVGIGTTAPGGVLEIENGQAGVKKLFIDDTNANSGDYHIYTESGSGGSNTAQFWVQSDGDGYFRGNVGIGTTAPETLSGYTHLEINNATNGGGCHVITRGYGIWKIYF